MFIGEKLRTEMRLTRIRLGWSMKEAARHLDVHPITYRKWENGTCSKCRLNSYRIILNMIRAQNNAPSAIETACQRVRNAYLTCHDDNARTLLAKRLRNTVVAALEYLGRPQ